MKIVFCRFYSVSDEVIMPLHFGYLSSSILPKKHQVVIIDQLRNRVSEDLMIESIVKEEPDILGISAYSKDIFFTKYMLSKIRPVLPKAKIIVGGVQMSLMPRETFEYFQDYIDYGFAGESELGFSKFVEVLDAHEMDSLSGDIPSLVWKDDDDIKVNKSLFIEDLDEIPFPEWELMPPDSYPKAPHGAFYRQYPYAPMITSRGCPYSCTFCAAGTLSGKKVRYRSIGNVIEEIKYLKTNFGVKEIHIEDDNFSIKKERVVDFSERLLKEAPGITWAFPNGLRLDNLDFKTLQLMQRAGCFGINVGVESGNDKRLKDIKKGFKTEKIKANIGLAKKAGLDVGGFFIIGFPGETREEINKTINFATKLDLDRIGLSYFQPYPGTEEYQRLYDAGKYAFDFNNSKHSLHTITYVPDSITKKELKDLRFKGFAKFYFRPKIVWKLLREIQSLEHFKYILKRGMRWLNN